MKKYYDYIIYSANLNGILFAKYAASNGKSVLLLNRYGFPGGDITYGLNCLQTLPVEKSEYCAEILSALAKSKDGIFYSDKSYALLNPEVIKYILLQHLESISIDVLFHVLPTKVDWGLESSKITVAAREGSIVFESEKVFDASEENELINLINSPTKSSDSLRLNVFTSSNISKTELNSLPIVNHIKLSDNRNWISFAVQQDNEVPLEYSYQSLLKEIDAKLLDNNVRLQVVPAQHVNEKRFSNISEHPNFYFNASTFWGLKRKLNSRLIDISILENKLRDFGF